MNPTPSRLSNPFFHRQIRLAHPSETRPPHSQPFNIRTTAAPTMAALTTPDQTAAKRDCGDT
ncbi:hypothetical protein RESH_04062 [Rhodopirellula europaea SH398]|uniref:Uncharacterized protein n=1 Tax=Rhodopirellula europaea SH398 TaxID=1263868 RepID=M5SCE5_9BACT|nr:hypothetical protein RESH_04062 [Rhodopirellula europaea SH398]